MHKGPQTVKAESHISYTDNKGNEVFRYRANGKFYVPLGNIGRDEAIALRDAINLALEIDSQDTKDEV